MKKWLRLFDLNSYFSGAAAGWAAAGAMAISAASGLYSASEQKKAQEDAEKEQRRLEQEALDEEQRIFAAQAAEMGNTGAETVQFGVDDGDNQMGSYDDFLTPMSSGTSGLGTSNQTSGLGFSL